MAERFALMIEWMCRAVAERGGRRQLAGPLVVLIWSYLRRLGRRFARLAAKPRAIRTRRPEPPRQRPPRASRLPGADMWLIRLVPETAAGASQLRLLLADPEMAALIASRPQMGRILRPLCHMLGVRPTAAELPAPPPRRRREPERAAAASPSPPPSPPGPEPTPAPALQPPPTARSPLKTG